MFSNRRGWLDVPGVPGAPWTALPGSFFVILHGWKMPGDGLLTVPFSLPDHPDLQGLALTNQALLSGTDYAIVLSNGATRIVGE